MLFVHDIILTGKDQITINRVKEKLKTRFKMKDLGEMSTFLGINIEKTNSGLYLNQSNYLQRLLKRFGMEDCKPVTSPIETKISNDCKDEIDLTNEPYRELVGCLLYVTQTTRPDVCFSVNYFSRYQSRPKTSHWKELKRYFTLY